MVLPNLHSPSQRVEYMNFIIIIIVAVRGLLLLPWKRPPWGTGKGANVEPEERGRSGHDEGRNPISEDSVKQTRLPVTRTRTASLTRRGLLGEGV